MSTSNSNSGFFSLLGLAVLVFSYTLFDYINSGSSLLFTTLQLLTLIWLLLSAHPLKLGLLSILPFVLVSPLMVLRLNTVQALALYHIALSIFVLHILFKCNMSSRERSFLYMMFLLSYCYASYIHPLFTPFSMGIYGGFLSHLLILALGVVLHQRDEQETEARELREKLIHLKSEFRDSEQDPLMGIFSKSGGMKVLKQTMKWSQRYEIPLTICYMELNNCRDDYILSITRRIVNRVRESDTLFRLGKSEILLILPDCQKNDAASVMSSIQEILRNDREMEAVRYGLAAFRGEERTSPNELIINANQSIA